MTTITTKTERRSTTGAGKVSPSCQPRLAAVGRRLGRRRCCSSSTHGYRVIAHDRRGHGRSTQTGPGHDMDHYADDLATLTAITTSRRRCTSAHSYTASATCATTWRATARAGWQQRSIISAVPPLMVKTAANPGGCPRRCSTSFRRSSRDRAQFYYDVASGPFLWLQPAGANLSGADLDWWRRE